MHRTPRWAAAPEFGVAVRSCLGVDLCGPRPLERGRVAAYVAGQVSELCRRGWRAPAILAHGPLPEAGHGWVREYLAGRSATVLDAALLDDLTMLISRWADAPAGEHRSDMARWAIAVVFDDEAGWWATANEAGPDVAAFCRRLCACAWVGDNVIMSGRRD